MKEEKTKKEVRKEESEKLGKELSFRERVEFQFKEAEKSFLQDRLEEGINRAFAGIKLMLYYIIELLENSRK
jgi:hypothetical protein